MSHFLLLNAQLSAQATLQYFIVVVRLISAATAQNSDPRRRSPLCAGDAAPTALIYAHYDVQPADPLEMWHTPPFSPVLDEEAGLFRGRGVSDNKQGVLMVRYLIVFV
jgi:acetylornithine deacetylase/succinyl-diaminopimelate desuccinylase-like protein